MPEFTLPVVTQSGANTMGFVLNGRVWQNYGRRCTTQFGCYDNILSVSYTDGLTGNAFNMYGGATASKVDELFVLYIDSLNAPGTYLSDTIVGASCNSPTNTLVFNDEWNSKNYVSSINNPSRITITRLDTVTHIVSGTFEGTLYERKDSTPTITITQGRFDMNYLNK